eukprot:gene2402-2437_t
MASPLGLLVSHGAQGLLANPIPFVLDRDQGPSGRLRGHLARSNPQWAEFLTAPQALIVFSGLDHYISPSYYPTKQENGKVVPTWNYIQVHVYGQVEIHQDADWLRTQIGALTDQHERPRAEPWAVEDAPDAFIAQQMRAIVGIEIRIDRIEGKWKLSQNRTAADQQGVHEGLSKEVNSAAQAMGAMIPLQK